MSAISSGVTTTTVTGGEKIRRYIRRERTQGGVDVARRFVREFPLSRFRSGLPVDSGDLKKSVRLLQRGSNVELRGAKYGRFVRWRDRQGVRQRTRTVGGNFLSQAGQTLRRWKA